MASPEMKGATAMRGLRQMGMPLVAAVLALSGCGSAQPTATTASVNAGSTPPATTESAATTTAAAATTTSAYRVVHWVNEPWPFTLQLVSISKSLEGYLGLGSAPPKWDWLMVRVNITNQSPGRTPPTPELQLRCSGPGSSVWNPNDAHVATPMLQGYEQQPGANRLSLASQVGLGYGVPQTYAAEWEVPESTNTSEVRCALEEADHHMLALN
jgi:hypothetical protein